MPNTAPPKRFYWEEVTREDHPSLTVMRDNEGDAVASFPPGWSDDDIRYAMNLANDWYGRGYEVGGRAKEREIIRALNLHEHLKL